MHITYSPTGYYLNSAKDFSTSLHYKMTGSLNSNGSRGWYRPWIVSPLSLEQGRGPVVLNLLIKIRGTEVLRVF